MIPITLSQAVVDAGGTLADPADLMVTGVVSDTRQIGDGDLFVAIAGDRVDGSTLAGAAIKAGAAGILTADPDIAAIPARRGTALLPWMIH